MVAKVSSRCTRFNFKLVVHCLCGQRPVSISQLDNATLLDRQLGMILDESV